MSLEEVARRTVEGMVGKALLASALTLIMAGVGFVHNEFSGLHEDISKHSSQLATISQQMGDLIVAVKDHDTTVDAALNKLSTDDQANALAIGRAQAQIEAMRSDPPRIEREFIPAPPTTLPAIGNTFQHLLGIPTHPHHQWRRRP